MENCLEAMLDFNIIDEKDRSRLINAGEMNISALSQPSEQDHSQVARQTSGLEIDEENLN